MSPRAALRGLPPTTRGFLREAPAIAGIGIFLAKDSYNRRRERHPKMTPPTKRPLRYCPCWGCWDPDEGLRFTRRLAGWPLRTVPTKWRYGPATTSLGVHRLLPPTLEIDAAVASRRQRAADAAISEVIPSRKRALPLYHNSGNASTAPLVGAFFVLGGNSHRCENGCESLCNLC